MDVVYCRKPDVELDMSIINEIRNTEEGNALRVYANNDLINVVISNRYHLHLKNSKGGRSVFGSEKGVLPTPYIY